MKKRRVVIIGSGFGGLIAGNLLAKRGHKVTIFESHNMPGGYIAGFKHSGYYFESGTLSFESSASVFKAMKDIGVYDRIEFVRQNVGIIYKGFDGSILTYEESKKAYYRSFTEYKEQLDSFFSELDRFTGAAEVMSLPMLYLYSGFSFFLALVPLILKGGRFMKLMNEYKDLTTSEFLSRYFPKGSKIYNFLYSFGYPDMNAAYLAANLAGSGINSDYWTVKTGMRSWADTMAESFRKYGGELRLNSHVDRILTSKGTAVGVACNSAEYYADYVISASDYKKTFLKLLDKPELMKPDFAEKLKKAEVSAGFFTVYLGLNLPNLFLQKYLKTPHSMYFSNGETADIHNNKDENFFDKSLLMIYSPSLVNPDHAPEGKSSLMLQTMVPYGWMKNWGDGDRNRYMELKKTAMNAMIKRMTALIPGLESLIEYRDAATPLTYERYTHNSGGATSSWNWNPKKNFFGGNMSVNIDTPIKNLFIGSCWAMSIGGIPGALAAAYMCAKKIR